jgi:hypothetical protein
MHVMLSYPKSGRTWLRFMVDSYLCRVFDLDCPNVFDAEKRLKPTHPIEWTHLTGAMIGRLPYWAMGPWRLDEAATRVPWLVLTRNFRATLASAYFQARDRIKVFEGSPREFVRDPRYGAIKLVSFYNLFEELRPKLADCRVFSYEAMLEDPRPHFERVVAALGMRVDADLIDEVIEQASFENMKRLSVTPEYAGSVLAPTDPNNPVTFKVRSGGRDKKQLFSAEDIVYIERVIDDLFQHKDKPDYARCLGDPTARPETPHQKEAHAA